MMSRARMGSWSALLGMVLSLAACDDMYIPSTHFNEGRLPMGARQRRVLTPGRSETDAGGRQQNNDAQADGRQRRSGDFVAALALGNLATRVIVVRARTLRQGLSLDCAGLKQAPERALSLPAFGPPKMWEIAPGRAAPLNAPAVGGGNCRVILLESVDFGSRIVFWDHDTYPAQSLSAVADEVPAGRLLRFSMAGDEPMFAWHPALHPGPKTVDDTAPPCALPGAASAIGWSTPLPVGVQKVTEVQAAPDGCLGLLLKGGQGLGKWVLCLPGGAFPFDAGDAFVVTAISKGHLGQGNVQGVELVGEGVTLRLGVGDVVVAHGSGPVAEISLIAGCLGQHDTCGGHALPLGLTFKDATGVTQLLSGQHMELAGGGRLYLVGARQLQVLDPVCSPGPFKRRLETVYVSALP